MRHTPTPLRAWDNESLNAVGKRIDAALQHWSAAWLAPSAHACAGPALNATGCGLGSLPWNALGESASGGRCWWSSTQPVRALCLRLLFGSEAHAPGSISEAVASKCEAALRDAIASGLGVTRPGNASVPRDLGRWSGCVVVPVLSQGKPVIHVLLDADAVQALAPCRVEGAPPRVKGLVAARDALARWPLEVRACLRPLKLDLGTLVDLRAGDLVALDHGLDEPLTLHAGASELFSVHLGRHGACKALQIAAREST